MIIFRFGILINGNNLKLWQLDCVNMLIEKGHILDLIIENIDDISPLNSKIRKYFGNNGVYNIYSRLHLQKDKMSNVNCENIFSDYNRIKIKPILNGKYSQYFSDLDVENIHNYNLDFILRFGFNILRGKVLNSARYGIWSFHHDDEKVIRGGPPGFWEIFFKHGLNGVILQRLTDKLDGGLIIHKALVPVISHSYSTHLNELLKFGVHILEFACENLQNNELIEWQLSNNSDVKIYRNPNNIDMLKFFVTLLKNRVIFNYNDLFRQEEWNIAVLKQSADNLIDQQRLTNILFYPRLVRNYFLADPFVFFNSNILEIFFENYSYKSHKGKISKLIYNIPKEEFLEMNDIIEKDIHLAFPFFYSCDKKDYLLAESSQNNQLLGYRLDISHCFIEREEIWMNSDCVDSVVFTYLNVEWLFCTNKSKGSNQFLFAYFRDKVANKWMPHNMNPIISDISKARMAGNIILSNGNYYRPAQKNNIIYGESIRFFKIINLTKDTFLEEEVFNIDATKLSKFNKGIHTISYSGDYLVIDAKRYVFIFSEFWFKLKRKFKYV